MKRWLGVLAVLCLFVSVPAVVYAGGAASGVNLSWGECGIFGTQDKTFACAVSTGADIMYGSFSSPVAVDSLNGNEVVIDVITDLDPVPAWWQLGNGGCRQGAGTVDFNFLANSNCVDFWAGQALGGVGWFTPPVGGPGSSFPQSTRRARAYAVCAIALEAAGPVAAGVETYSFKFTVSHTKTTGGTACAGCAAKVCFQLNTIKLTQNPGVPPTFSNPYDGSPTSDVYVSNTLNRSFVTYQNPGSLADCAVVPTRNTTWGQVKNLYR